MRLEHDHAWLEVASALKSNYNQLVRGRPALSMLLTAHQDHLITGYRAKKFCKMSI